MKKMSKFNNLKKFEDYLSDTKSSNILSFGEYRKGSNEYGSFIQEVMMFLRSFRNNNENDLTFRTKDIKFDLNKLQKLKNDVNRKRLISFDIKFTDKDGMELNNIDNNGFVIFSNLDKKEDRPWENKNDFNEERI